jgi:hypothetical protein
VPTPPLWADAELPPWSQLRRRLREDPDVRQWLRAELGRHPATSEQLTGLLPYHLPVPSNSTRFSGTWQPGGTDVLVKVNITELERFWMSTASGPTPPVAPASRAT